MSKFDDKTLEYQGDDELPDVNDDDSDIDEDDNYPWYDESDDDEDEDDESVEENWN